MGFSCALAGYEVDKCWVDPGIVFVFAFLFILVLVKRAGFWFTNGCFLVQVIFFFVWEIFCQFTVSSVFKIRITTDIALCWFAEYQFLIKCLIKITRGEIINWRWCRRVFSLVMLVRYGDVDLWVICNSFCFPLPCFVGEVWRLLVVCVEIFVWRCPSLYIIVPSYVFSLVHCFGSSSLCSFCIIF